MTDNCHFDRIRVKLFDDYITNKRKPTSHPERIGTYTLNILNEMYFECIIRISALTRSLIAYAIYVFKTRRRSFQ